MKMMNISQYMMKFVNYAKIIPVLKKQKQENNFGLVWS